MAIKFAMPHAVSRRGKSIFRGSAWSQVAMWDCPGGGDAAFELGSKWWVSCDPRVLRDGYWASFIATKVVFLYFVCGKSVLGDSKRYIAP